MIKGENMIKAILFDFWGTLVENGVWSPTKQVQRILNIKLNFPEYVVRMEKAMMTKPFDSLTAAFNAIGEEFSIKIDERQMEELIGLWNKNWMLAKPYLETKETLESLQKRYDLILVSNTNSLGINNVLDKFDLGKYFKRTFLSCDLGLIKTDSKFFEKVLSKLKLQPQEVVMVGDSVQSDMKAAKDAGIKGILIDRRNSREYEYRITNLKQITEVILNE